MPNHPINVAIIGVGNCASSLVQGVQYYHEAGEDEFIPGLMHPMLGGYHISDINFVAAFDVNKTKVGKDLSEAIKADPNNTIQFAEVPFTGVKVEKGMTHDGIGKYLEDTIEEAPGETADIVTILKDTDTHVVINYLPVGSEEATKWYVEQVLAAGCAFINCIPVFIAKEHYWQDRFEQAGLPVVGDDIKSQEGVGFGNIPLNLELKLEFWDSPNSAGVVIDAIRCARIALDRGVAGALEAPSSYFMKSPPVQVTNDQARDAVEAFILNGKAA